MSTEREEREEPERVREEVRTSRWRGEKCGENVRGGDVGEVEMEREGTEVRSSKRIK